LPRDLLGQMISSSLEEDLVFFWVLTAFLVLGLWLELELAPEEGRCLWGREFRPEEGRCLWSPELRDLVC
jgi:hypothetical protein